MARYLKQEERIVMTHIRVLLYRKKQTRKVLTQLSSPKMKLQKSALAKLSTVFLVSQQRN